MNEEQERFARLMAFGCIVAEELREMLFTLNATVGKMRDGKKEAVIEAVNDATKRVQFIRRQTDLVLKQLTDEKLSTFPV